MKKLALCLLSVLLLQSTAHATVLDFLSRNAPNQGYDTDPTKSGTQLAGDPYAGGNWGYFRYDENGTKGYLDKNGMYFYPSDLNPDLNAVPSDADNLNRPPLFVVSKNNRKLAAQVMIVRAKKSTKVKWECKKIFGIVVKDSCKLVKK